MSRRLIATALVATGVALPALAQTSTAPANPPATTSPASPSGPSTTSGQFMTEQSANQWRASKLVGVEVFGADNRRIGDINEVLLNKDGMAAAVVIGVGGFLGMGEKNVAVPFKSLEWTTEPRATTGTTVPDTTGTVTGPPVPGTTATATIPRADPVTVEALQGYPDRAVLRMTRADLQNAPAFRYASDTRATTPAPTTGTNPPVTTNPPATAPRQ
jgi:sporulation protein YlmC with PRC-barrel domain